MPVFFRDPRGDQFAPCRTLSDPIGLAQALARRKDSVLAARMDDGERPIRPDGVTDAGHFREAHGMVDAVLRPHPAAAKCHDREAQGARVDARDLARRSREDRLHQRRRGKMLCRRIEQVRRAAERHDHAGEAFRRSARGESLLDPAAGLFQIRRQAAEQQHLGAERDGDLMEARLAAAAGQVIERIGDLERIAGGARQRLVHVGEQRRGRQAGIIGDADERLRQRARLRRLGQEGAGAELHIHGKAVQAGRELLGQDRGSDQRQRFDRRRDVADGVEALVGRRQIGGLADDGAARLAHHLAEQRGVGLRDIAGHGVELVERAAGMAEAAAGDHRHVAATGRDGGRERQAHRVADAAGRMLVESRARQIVPVQHRAGIAHGERQRHSLLRGHVPEEHGHGEGRCLSLADRAVGQAGDELADVGVRQFAAVALGRDDLLREPHQ